MQKAESREKELERQGEGLAKRLQELQERIAKHQVDLAAAKADRVAAKASVLNSGCGGGDPGAVPVSLAGAFSVVQAKL